MAVFVWAGMTPEVLLDRQRAGEVIRAFQPDTQPTPANPNGGLYRTPAGCLIATPNGLELTGDGGRAAGGRCSDVLGVSVTTCLPPPQPAPTRHRELRHQRPC